MKRTWFSRAIFFSWYCSKGDCRFCYMSTQPEKTKKIPRRSVESILAEVIICKKLGWEIGFISGGFDAYKQVEFENLLRNIHKVYGRKLWINVGDLSMEEMEKYKPYVRGVAAAVETLNPELHDYMCPSKPLKPIVKMVEDAKKLGLERAMTYILGLGETIKDYNLLKDFIRKHEISKIHFYSLNPHKGTIFENKKSPSKEYQGRWISMTRKDFPGIEIQAGIWLDRVKNVSYLLKCGATSITKYPAIKYFGSTQSREIEHQAWLAGREFLGSLTVLPEMDIDEEVKSVPVALRNKLKKKLEQYLKQMK